MIIPITIGLIIGLIAFAAGALKMIWDTFSGPVFVIIANLYCNLRVQITENAFRKTFGFSF